MGYKKPKVVFTDDKPSYVGKIKKKFKKELHSTKKAYKKNGSMDSLSSSLGSFGAQFKKKKKTRFREWAIREQKR